MYVIMYHRPKDRFVWRQEAASLRIACQYIRVFNDAGFTDIQFVSY